MKLFHKGLLILSIPLLFELSFFTILFNLDQRAESAAKRLAERRQTSEELIDTLGAMFALDRLLRRYSAQIVRGDDGNGLTRDHNLKVLWGFKDEFFALKKSLDIHFRNLKLSLKSDKEAMTVIGKSENDVQMVYHALYAAALMSSQGIATTPVILNGTKRNIESAFLESASPELLRLAQQHEGEAIERKSLDRERARITAIISLAIPVSVAVAIFSMWLFTRNFLSRLSILHENTVRFSRGVALLPQIAGNDEIVKVDIAFHNAIDRLRAEEQKVVQAFQNTADLICGLDEQYKILVVNRAWEEACKTTSDYFIGKSLIDFIAENDSQACIQSIEASRTAVVDPLEIAVVFRDKLIVEALLKIRWVASEKMFYCIFNDISQRKQTENIRNQVFTMISHDLRAPLASFTSFIELLELGSFGTLNEKGERFLSYATSSTGRMQRLIENILRMERIKSQRIVKREEIRVEQFLTNIADSLRVDAQKKFVTLEVEADSESVVYSDPVILEAVLANFLANALNVAPKHSAITLAAVSDGHTFTFSVRDLGPGIAAEDIANLKSKFFQVASNSATRRPGFGLGLHIAHELAEILDAKIDIDTSPGAGATFKLVLTEFGPAQSSG